jgi:hypothetical protein
MNKKRKFEDEIENCKNELTSNENFENSATKKKIFMR